jgi:hypothetical protein
MWGQRGSDTGVWLKLHLKYIQKIRIEKKYNKSISGDLIGNIRLLIETARHNVAVTVNAGLTILYSDHRKSRL